MTSHQTVTWIDSISWNLFNGTLVITSITGKIALASIICQLHAIGKTIFPKIFATFGHKFVSTNHVLKTKILNLESNLSLLRVTQTFLKYYKSI